MTEQEWIMAAMHGEESAISWLVEAYQPMVYGLCYRMLGSPTDAEDAAQDALVKAVMSLQSFDLERPFKPWVLRIASNLCTDRLRRRRPEVSLDGMGDDGAWEWQAGSDPSPEQQLEARERQKAIQALLETLSPVDRLVVTLYYWQDLSYEEIAEATHLSVSAVKSRLFRARRGMAECWAQNQNDGGSQCNTGMREAHYVGHAQ